MNIELTRKLQGAIELLLESASRINEAKPQRYWYPLSMAAYGAEEIIEALDSMCNFRTTMWEKTRMFEGLFAQFQGSPHAIMVNSGSSADLLLSFLLVSPPDGILRPGDTVLVPAVTWPTHIWSILMAGLNVRLVDVDPETLNLSLEDLERKAKPPAKALFLVHIMGNPCPMDSVLEIARSRNLVLLEDCCEALGSEWNGRKVGTFGLGSSFSFFFSHHMTTMEGGMITVGDPLLADRLRVLRAHGWLRNVDSADFASLAGYDVDPRYAFVGWGFNVRPTELQAGFGLCQIEKLPRFNERRVSLGERFYSFVEGCEFLRKPRVAPGAKSVWMALPVLVDRGAPFRRGDLTLYLEEAGVETRPIVTGNIARQPAAKMFPAFREGSCPGADIVHEQGFYLGLSPLTADQDMDRLIELLADFVKRY
ncbi:MAG: DegT/DnrJ/EryC1/StrS family aminotransferase [Deltaproteobacteria bacterium]|nr:DegT/DnrJ/EryC1/StrS family aminotransferase [Deltaproteobacteria bacterium]